MSSTHYIILSWNVDGYNNDVHNWLLQLVKISRPDVIFLSETKRKAQDLTSLFSVFTEYNIIINAHIPTNFHGVAMFIRKDHSYEELPITMNIPVRKDSKSKEAAIGRIIVIRLNKEMYIIGSYTPNSGRSDKEKLYYRTKLWDPAFFYLLEIIRNNGPTLWIGDINVALDDIDVSSPQLMKEYAGFTPEECANFKALLSTGNWIDVWRFQHPEGRIYTWRGYYQTTNYGMRIDNIIASKSLLPKMLNAFGLINSPISSDHIPIGVYIKRS